MRESITEPGMFLAVLLISTLSLSAIVNAEDTTPVPDPVTMIRTTLKSWRGMYHTYQDEMNLGYCWADYFLDVKKIFDTLTGPRVIGTEPDDPTPVTNVLNGLMYPDQGPVAQNKIVNTAENPEDPQKSDETLDGDDSVEYPYGDENLGPGDSASEWDDGQKNGGYPSEGQRGSNHPVSGYDGRFQQQALVFPGLQQQASIFPSDQRQASIFPGDQQRPFNGYGNIPSDPNISGGRSLSDSTLSEEESELGIVPGRPSSSSSLSEVASERIIDKYNGTSSVNTTETEEHISDQERSTVGNTWNPDDRGERSMINIPTPRGLSDVIINGLGFNVPPGLGPLMFGVGPNPIMFTLVRLIGTFMRVGRQVMDVIESTSILACTKNYLWGKMVNWIDS